MMQKFYVRYYERGIIGDYVIFTEEEYLSKIEEEVANIYGIDEDEEFDADEYLDDELEAVIEFDGAKCETIEDAIIELVKNFECEELDYHDLKINREDILYSESITVKIFKDYDLNLVFEIIEEDEDDIYNSKIKNAYIEFI